MGDCPIYTYTGLDDSVDKNYIASSNIVLFLGCTNSSDASVWYPTLFSENSVYSISVMRFWCISVILDFVYKKYVQT